MADPTLTRRGVLAGAALLVPVFLAGCTSQGTDSSAPTDGSGSATETKPGARFGAGSYNTEAVAQELAHIEDTVGPVQDGDALRVLVTGSTAGLGELTAMHLIARGHQVVAHARNQDRAADVRRDVPGLTDVVVGDFTDLDQTHRLIDDVNELGPFDVVVHNVGVYDGTPEETLAVNTLSPYLLTSLMEKPKRLVYLSSNAHHGDLQLDQITRDGGGVSYEESKAQISTLAMAVNRLWAEVEVNLVHPGWVPTRMGELTGSPTDDLREGYTTQVWLTEAIEPASRVSGQFLFHEEPYEPVNPTIHDTSAQNDLLAALETATKVRLARS